MTDLRDTGLYTLMKGDMQGAVDTLERAHRLDPLDYKTLFYLGTAYLESSRQEEGRRTLIDAMRMRPTDHHSLAELGQILQKIEWNREAIDLISAEAGKESPLVIGEKVRMLLAALGHPLREEKVPLGTARHGSYPEQTEQSNAIPQFAELDMSIYQSRAVANEAGSRYPQQVKQKSKPLEEIDSFNMLRALMSWGTLSFNPVRFYRAEMRRTGFKAPFAMLIVQSLACSILTLIIIHSTSGTFTPQFTALGATHLTDYILGQFAIPIFISVGFTTICMTYAVLLHLLLKAFDSANTFADSFRLSVYSFTPFVDFWVLMLFSAFMPSAAFLLDGIVGGITYLRCGVHIGIGAHHIHELDSGKAAGVAILCLVISFMGFAMILGAISSLSSGP